MEDRLKGLEEGDPPYHVKMFLKEEPLSKAKRLAGRARIIFSLSLEDQVVDRILFGSWHDAETKNCSRVTNKIGWSPVPEGYRMVRCSFPPGTQVLATDCSAFDWTFPYWTVELIVKWKLEQVVDPTPLYERLVRSRVREVLGSGCLVRFPDGTVMQQQFDGLMKSGWLLTISMNGWAQLAINALAWMRYRETLTWKIFPKLWAMGDDVLLSWDSRDDHLEFERHLITTGILVKRGKLRLEFAGFEFVYDGLSTYVNPLYIDKHQFQLRHYSEEELKEVVDMYCCLYALADEKTREWLEPLQRKYANRTQTWFKSWAYGFPLGGIPGLQTSDFVF